MLRLLQQGESLSLPQSRPMSTIGTHCHELRVKDADKEWRVVYYLDSDFVVILEVFNKTTKTTPKPVIDICKKRLAQFLKDKKEVSHE
ncbi:MAG: hypothetical protein OHK0029_06920 [Armatimonadaceae bacterium]